MKHTGLLFILMSLCIKLSAQTSFDSAKIAPIIEKKKLIDGLVSRSENLTTDQLHIWYKKGMIVRYVKAKNNLPPVEKEIESTEQRELDILIFKDSLGRIFYAREAMYFANSKWSVHAGYYFDTTGNTIALDVSGSQSLGGDNFDEGSRTSYYSYDSVWSFKRCVGQSMNCSGFDELPITPTSSIDEFLAKKKIKPK